MTITDPAGTINRRTWSYSVDWGDGTTEDFQGDVEIAAGSFSATADLTHQYFDEGAYTVVVLLKDASGQTLEQQVSIEVANDTPNVVATLPANVLEDELFSVSATIVDSDDVEVLWDFGDGTASQFGRSVSHQYGRSDEFIVTLTVTDFGDPNNDDDDLVQVQSFNIEATPVNDLPFLRPITAVSVTETFPLTLPTFAVDEDGDALSYGLSGAPDGVTIDAFGVIRWTPTVDQGPATYAFDVEVEDGEGGVTEPVTITVLDTGSITGMLFEDEDGNGVFDFGEPVIAGQSVRIDEGNDGTFDQTIQVGEDGTFQFVNLPIGLYRVVVDVPAGGQRTTPNSFVVDMPAVGDFEIIPVGTVSDTDGDGISNLDEQNSIVGLDGNRDGTPDWQQGNVATVLTSGGPVTITSNSGTVLADSSSQGAGLVPETDAAYPFGEINFAVTGLSAGGQAEVELTLHGGGSITAVYVADPFDLVDQTYFELGEDSSTLFASAPGTVELTVTDGGLDDTDQSADARVQFDLLLSEQNAGWRNPSTSKIGPGENGYTENGVWRVSDQPGSTGGPSRVSGDPEATSQWEAVDLPAGFYRVVFYNVIHPNSTEAALIEVVHNGQTDAIQVDQTRGSSGWVDLGVYDFSGVAGELVRLSNADIGFLRADAVHFTPVQTPVMIDNGDAGYSESGAWRNSSVLGNAESRTRFSGDRDANVTWTPPILTAGRYEVSLYNVVRRGSVTDGLVEITHGGQVSAQTLNQSAGVAGWVSLGSFEFTGGGDERVSLSSVGLGFLRADAVRFSPVGNVIDNFDVGYSEVRGAFVNHSERGFAGGGARVSQAEDAAVSYRPNSLPAGRYAVEYFNVASDNTTGEIGVSVYHAVGVSEFERFPSDSVSDWVSIGEYEFTGNANERVVLTNQDDGSFIVDAVRFIPVDRVVDGILRIDNSDAGYVEEFGVWANSRRIGSESSSTRQSADASAVARWDLGIFEPGTYQVQLFNVVDSISTASANVEITHAGQASNVLLNQTDGDSGYIGLGFYDFNGQGNESIRLSNLGSGRLRADAVRLVRVLTAFSPQQPSDGLDIPEDVNGDNQVTARDALMIINRLGVIPSGEQFGNNATSASTGLESFDVTWDGQVTALDALRVVNYLGRTPTSADGESLITQQSLPSQDDDAQIWEVDAVDQALSEGDLF